MAAQDAEADEGGRRTGEPGGAEGPAPLLHEGVPEGGVQGAHHLQRGRGRARAGLQHPGDQCAPANILLLNPTALCSFGPAQPAHAVRVRMTAVNLRNIA